MGGCGDVGFVGAEAAATAVVELLTVKALGPCARGPDEKLAERTELADLNVGVTSERRALGKHRSAVATYRLRSMRTFAAATSSLARRVARSWSHSVASAG